MIQRTIEAAELIDPVKDFRMFRLLSIFIDAWADHNWSIWETTLLADERQQNSVDREGWNDAPAKRTLHSWGFRDCNGVFMAAGLTENQRKVMEIAYEGRARYTPAEIAERLGWPAIRVRVHLHNATERLKQWASLNALVPYTHVETKHTFQQGSTNANCPASDRAWEPEALCSCGVGC